MILDAMIERYNYLMKLETVDEMQRRELLNLHGALTALQGELGAIVDFHEAVGAPAAFAESATEAIDEALKPTGR